MVIQYKLCKLLMRSLGDYTRLVIECHTKRFESWAGEMLCEAAEFPYLYHC